MGHVCYNYIAKQVNKELRTLKNLTVGLGMKQGMPSKSSEQERLPIPAQYSSNSVMFIDRIGD